MTSVIGMPIVKKDSQDGDIRKLLKPRSPRKNGFRPQAQNITRPKPRMLTKEPSSSKYDTSSAVYNSPKSFYQSPVSSSPEPFYPPPVSSSPEPLYSIPEPPLGLCSTKTCRTPWSHWKYKRCDKCRDKEKKKVERRKERENASRVRTELLVKAWNSLPIEERLAGYMEQLRVKGLVATRRSTTVLGKRKAEQDFAEQPLRDIHPNEAPIDEYQSANELHAALQTVLSTGYMPTHFIGHFSVVRPLYEVIVKQKVMDEAEELALGTDLNFRCNFVFECVFVYGLTLLVRFDLKPVKHMSIVDGQAAIRLEYFCACTATCTGRIFIGMEKVKTKFLAGEKVTVRIKHW